jgi:hypothetical protein
MKQLILWCLIAQLSACVAHGVRCDGSLQPVNRLDHTEAAAP